MAARSAKNTWRYPVSISRVICFLCAI